jgi:hypothetical protein
MAGVASPMFRREVREGIRFLSGLVTGALAASLFVAVFLFVIGTLIQLTTPRIWRIDLLIAWCFGLGVADLLGFTPQRWRQVPEALLWGGLTPGALGIAWGLDQGIVVTTQKATSCFWVLMAAIALIAPASAFGLIPLIAVVSCGGVAIVSVLRFASACLISRAADPWLSAARRGSGLLLVVLALLLALGAVAT